ncbi:MAG: DUF5610 domain-containing protein [Rhodocyclaceae bacterium]|nr:DUF5610 domain-containing protein [Rhodocyclaceae bacterium]MDZ4214332.1 DUF5610 domain-containing protein [Rhodocyclaceae bacterium]
MNDSLISPVVTGRPPINEAEKGKSAETQGVGTVATARKQLNVQILQSSMELTIQAGDKSLELVFRAAIERINELLEPELGPNALQNAQAQDNSPEGTAARIVSLSTGFFEAYAAQHPDKDQATKAENFVALIRSGFEKGFNEAADILKGLDVFQGDIEAGVMKTHELVQKGFDDFLASKLSPPADAAEHAH